MYITVYVPAVLRAGVIAPVVVLILNPEGMALYVPPGVPIRVTGWPVKRVLQNGFPGYVIIAVGEVTILTIVVAVTIAQPPAAGIV